MRKYGLKAALGLSLLVLSLGLMVPAAATAQNVVTVECQDGDVLTGSYADVIVNGTSCNLDGATVNGSVLVSNGGTLSARGDAEVRGSIQIDSGGNINLEDVTVLGDVALKDSQDVTVGTAATIGTLKVEKSGAVDARGFLGSIESKESGGISLDGATVFPGGVNMGLATGSLVICESTIEGQVNVIETTGDVLVEALGSCGASTIDGLVALEKGTGDVRLAGAQLTAGDLIVIEQNGDVDVSSTSLSDLKIEKITGSATVASVMADSDTTIAGITGTATIRSSTLRGDVEIKSAGDVTLDNVTSTSDTSIVDNGDVRIDSSELGGDMKITSNEGVIVAGNNFSLEDILISNNSGPVAVDGNVDLSLSIIENDDVTVSGNTFTDAEVSKNTGGVSIVGNTGEKLNCSDNSPAPTGSGNTITELADGQCAGF